MGSLGAIGDGGGLTQLALSPFLLLLLSLLLPLGYSCRVRSGQKMNMEQTDSNTGLAHLACIFGRGCAICGRRLKTILVVINGMRHGLNKILYYVIGAYTIAKMKH